MYASLHRSYFYLLRTVTELRLVLKGNHITSCYTQERDKLYLHIPLQEFPSFHLIISTNPQEFSIQIKKEHHKAQKNIYEFFRLHFPQKIADIKIAFGERIIRIDLEKGFLYIIFRGSKSNCFYFASSGEKETFKKITNQSLFLFEKEISQTIFIRDDSELLPLWDQFNTDQILRLPYISKELLIEAASRDGSLKENIINLLHEILFSKIAVGENLLSGVIFFSPLSFLKNGEYAEVELFDSYLEAVNQFLSIKREVAKETVQKNEIIKFLDRELEKLSDKLNNLKSRIDKGSHENTYKKYGDLLLANIYQMKKGMSNFIISDDYNSEVANIKLDQKLSPRHNIDRYYEKARSEKIEYRKSYELLLAAELQYNRYVDFKNQLDEDLSLEDLNKMKKKLKSNSQLNTGNEQKDKIPFRHFIISDKFHFYIGKDSKNNDQLTTKFAKQNDYWFHARSVAGSHGVLRVESTKEAIPKRILEKAASITAFFSKAKTSKLAPVTYTLKKYVSKNKRHEPGQVSVMKESVLLVKPEIPNDCIQHDD
jgi:predicted ribosome quality control (RQC) complex YloA/Tae2 family protein